MQAGWCRRRPPPSLREGRCLGLEHGGEPGQGAGPRTCSHGKGTGSPCPGPAGAEGKQVTTCQPRGLHAAPPSRVCVPGCRPAPQPQCTPNPVPSAPGPPGDSVLSPRAPCICSRGCHLFASFLSPPRSLPLFSRPGSCGMEKAELLSLRLLLDLPSLVHPMGTVTVPTSADSVTRGTGQKEALHGLALVTIAALNHSQLQ